jgi:hypothetical protein
VPLRNAFDRPAIGSPGAPEAGLAEKTIGFRAKSPYNPAKLVGHEEYCHA